MAPSHPPASVVIPTFNRLDGLRQVVAAVAAQLLPEPVAARPEILVVDDGSSDGTSGWLQRQASRGTLRALQQDHAGPARARNLGARAATGDVVLFLGDDTVPQPGWLAAHLEEHRLFSDQGPIAVVGYTSFPPEHDTPFLRFINEFGAQFGYQLIERSLDVPFKFFYTSNISLPRRELVDRGGFREDFPAAAWEDIEFAYRACTDGLRLQYQPRARVLHHHRIQPWTFCRRQRTSGLSAAIFSRLHPELAEFLGVGRLARLPALGGLHVRALCALITLSDAIRMTLPHRIYQRFVDLCYLRGLAAGLQE
jgi:glycosyltransferase involved in cell wall biosynthesis